MKKGINIFILLFFLVPGITKCSTMDKTIDKNANIEETTPESTVVETSAIIETTIPETTLIINLPEKSKLNSTGNKKLDDLADSILKNIIADGMNTREKAYAIYNYMVDNMRYSGVTKEGDWVSGAYTALSTNKGNCYGFYSGSRALLQRANIESVEVISIEKDHYWNLVNIDGSWYHFDTTSGWGGERFLLTDKELSEYNYYNTDINLNLTYNWDRNLYPKTP